MHLAVELVDRLFLSCNERSIDLLGPVFVPSLELIAILSQSSPSSDQEEIILKKEEQFEFSRIKHLALYTATCFIIAAKYDELDENIPLISDLQRYYTIKVLPAQIEAPTPEEVIECERLLMSKIFCWDLMSVADSMPTHLINYLLANGIVFDNE